MTRIAYGVLAGVAALAVAPSAAQAATSKPAATTGLAGGITPQSATLTGSVDPGGARTTYHFNYGRTKKYGLKTPSSALPAADGRVGAVAGITGLASNTVYHFRLVAHNAKGTVRGADRKFKTPKQPLGFAVAATPDPTPFGGITTIGGTLGGTGSAHRAVRLEQNPWPYVAGFRQVGNAQLTNATGGFNFPLIGVNLNAQYRVSTTDKNPTISPVVLSQVYVDATTKVHHKRVNRHARLQFSGKVHPALVGQRVSVQRRSGHTWKTVHATKTRKGGRTYATYKTRAKINRGGRYRVFVPIRDGRLKSHYSSSVTIHTRSR